MKHTHCLDCGAPISDSNESGLCRSCSARRTQAKRQAERDDLADVLDDRPGHTPMWAIKWYQCETEQAEVERRKQDPNRCKCGRVISDRARQCSKCNHADIKRRAQVRAQAHAFALRVLDGEVLRLRFNPGSEGGTVTQR